MITKVCEICAKDFQVKPYRKDKARFCSQVCGGKWHISQRPHIGNRFAKGNKLRQGLKPTNAFTSEQVRGANNPRWKEGQTFYCVGCGIIFKTKDWIVRQNGESKYCSIKCYDKNRPKGEDAPRWIEDKKTYRGRGWLKQRAKAVERDNETCQDCSKYVGKSIPVHHIRPFREFETAAEANRLENLVCLCQPCHMKREWDSQPFGAKPRSSV